MLAEEQIIENMKEDVELIFLPSFLYRSGQILDMEKITAEAHKRGIIAGFDLCHSIGSAPHLLDKWDLDFAVWCYIQTFKRWSRGSWRTFVNKKHFGQEPGLAGGFNSKKEMQFDMSHEMTPGADAGVCEIGTSHVLSMAQLIGSLAMFNEAGIEQVRQKLLQLTDYMIALINHQLNEYDLKIASPLDHSKHEGHIRL